MNKKIIHSKSNCGSTLQKFYSPEKEQVFSLNLDKNFQNESITNKTIFNIYSKKKYSRVLEMNEFLNSVEKLKKQLPNISNILNYTKNYKVEDKLFKKCEHQELENELKERLKKNNLKREKIKNELSILRINFKNIDNDISDILLDFNIFRDTEKYINIKNGDIKYQRKEKRLFKTLKLNKKIFDNNYNINSESNNFDDCKDISTPKNNSQTNKEKIFNFNNTDINDIKSNIFNSVPNYYKNISFKDDSNLKIISYINNNRTSKMIKLNNKLNILKGKKNKVIKMIKNLEEQKAKINLENGEIKNKLYNHYLQILKEGEDTRNEGLSWIIKEIFSLKKNVLISYLPKYLDEYCIAFIFKRAKLKEKIEQYEQRIMDIKKELANLGINHNFEKIENIWKKVEGAQFLGTKFQKININEFNKNEEKKSSKEKYLFKSILKKKKLFPKSNLLSNTNIKDKSDNNNISILKNNSVKKINLKNILSSSIKKIKKVKLSRNLPNKDNKLEKKVFSVSPRKSNVLNLGEVHKYQHNLSIGEIKKLLKDTKIKVNHECSQKIREYMVLNKEKNYFKKMLNEMINMEIQRILDEYSKRNYYQRFMVDRNIVLSALIGEDKLIELNKQLRKGKIYFKENYGTDNELIINSFKSNIQNKEHTKEKINIFG